LSFDANAASPTNSREDAINFSQTSHPDDSEDSIRMLALGPQDSVAEDPLYRVRKYLDDARKQTAETHNTETVLQASVIELAV
jgi:hypothetical protein